MTEHYGLATPQPQRAFHSGPWKLILQSDGFAELYNLESDPCELENLARDPSFSKIYRTMISELYKEMVNSQDTGFPMPQV